MFPHTFSAKKLNRTTIWENRLLIALLHIYFVLIFTFKLMEYSIRNSDLIFCSCKQYPLTFFFYKSHPLAQVKWQQNPSLSLPFESLANSQHSQWLQIPNRTIEKSVDFHTKNGTSNSFCANLNSMCQVCRYVPVELDANKIHHS